MSQIGINPGINRLVPDQTVAQVSPSLYAGAAAAGLNYSQMNQVNQIAGTVAMNKQLLALPKEEAQKQWKNLDPHIQEQIKAMYGQASYIPQPSAWQAPTNLGSLAHDAWRATTNTTGKILGPFKAAFKVAGEYGRVINTPYLVGREISQGANPFDWHIWKKAYDGKMIYDNGTLAELHKQYGDTDTFVAMQTLAGLKPGQIVDAYGKVDSNIINSLAKMMNEPEKFGTMLAQFKGAQVSYGRDLTRVMFNLQPSDNKLFSTGKWNKTSGLIDAVAQIVLDPLNLVSFGTAGAATKGARLAEQLANGTKTLEEVFARRDVQRTWNIAGDYIKRYTDAMKEKDFKKAGSIRERLGQEIPDLNSGDMVKLLSENEVFDAASAQKLFSHSDNMTKLLAGNVDGTAFFRNGVPIAKRSRMISSGLNRVMGDLFNGNLEKSALDKIGPDFVKDLEKVGIENDPYYKASTATLDAATSELAGVRRRLGRFTARHPGSNPVYVVDSMVDKSLNTVRDLARTIYPKAHAQYFAEAFKASTEADRVILLRGLYVQIMHNMGLTATAGGRDLMEKILREKFGDKVNFTINRELEIPPQHQDAVISRGLLEEQKSGTGGLLKTSLEGTVHPYNATPLIGNLPWHGQPGEASLADYAFNFNKNRHVREVIQAAGGATRSSFTRQMVDSWTSATLFPRLGVRSAIDEAFFYLMGQPGRDIVRYFQGRKIAKGIAAFTGSEELIPPLKQALLNKLGKNPLNAIPDKTIYDGDTIIRQGRAIKATDMNGEEVWRLAKRENVATEAMKLIEAVIPKHLHDYIFQAMVHHPEISNSVVNSIIGKSGLEEGLAGGELASEIISNSHLSQMFKESGLTQTGKIQEYDIDELAKANNSLVAKAHFENWFMRFTKNKANFKGTNDGLYDPATLFMRNNGHRTKEDFERSRSTLLRKVGINPETMAVEDSKALNRYLQLSQQHIRDLENGWSPVESAVKRIEVSLHDMYKTFHGSALNFNDRLYNYITTLAHDLEAEGQVHPNVAMRDALDSIDFKNFQELTKGFSPEGKINADVGFAKEATPEGIFQAMDRWNSLQHKAMEWMDSQNNHLFRQPALWLTYAKFRERYSKLETKFANDLIAKGMPKEMAAEVAEKRFTETAMNHASNQVLTYVDNPRVRSNLAWTLRTTGRFYRATEDFYRRVFRLKDVTPQVIYRLRLANVGFQSNGFVHPDQNGDPYLVVPADNIMFHAMNAGVGALLGKSDVIKQPMYNDFAIKLSLGSPSFQQDGGQPSLSGPFAAIPVMGLKYALGWFGGGWGKQQATNIDKLILGNVSQNLTPMKAIVPTSLQRIWGFIPKGEWDQQTVSAAMQAIAYNAANGKILSPAQMANLPRDQYDAKRADYLDSIKITTHNILFLRSFLGLISPISPTLMEDKGVPSYLKNVGIEGLRPEFADILQAVMRNSRGNIQDPYEAAIMAFTGKHPGKLVYTVARTAAQTVLVQKTKETQSWLTANSDKINKYGDASLIFAPNMGAYDSNVYTWMQASGMMSQKKLKDYLTDVSVAEDKRIYFNLGNMEAQAMRDPALNAEQRQSFINQTAAAKDALKARNPYLESALNQTGYGVGKQESMLVDLQGILADRSFPMDQAVRDKMSVAVSIINNTLDAIKVIGADQDAIDGGLQKQNLKNAAIQAIRELGGAQGRNAPQDPQIQEALRSIFIPILDNKARSTVRAVG